MSFGKLYILDGAGVPQPCPRLESWAKWRRAHPSVIAQHEAGETIVRTSFLGVDVQVLDNGPPLTFTTEVFLAIDNKKHEHTLESRFYETYEQALAGHEALVEAFSDMAGIIMRG